MSNIGVKFDFDKLNRPANIEEYKSGEKSSPCTNHAKESEIEEAKERLANVKSKLGLKYDNGKLRYDLYPLDAYEGCTKVLTFGAQKYAPNGWKSVEDPINRYYAALVRHLNSQMNHYKQGNVGLALDEESGLPHLDHAQCCLIFLRELSKNDEKTSREE